MSIHALAWALRQHELPPTDRIVLAHLADNAGHDNVVRGDRAHLTRGAAKATAIDHWRTEDAIVRLERDGYIRPIDDERGNGCELAIAVSASVEDDARALRAAAS